MLKPTARQIATELIEKAARERDKRYGYELHLTTSPVLVADPEIRGLDGIRAMSFNAMPRTTVGMGYIFVLYDFFERFSRGLAIYVAGRQRDAAEVPNYAGMCSDWVRVVTSETSDKVRAYLEQYGKEPRVEADSLTYRFEHTQDEFDRFLLGLAEALD